MSGWTDEIVASARKMIDDGETYAATAARLNRAFGTSFSRNAVIGKLLRAAGGIYKRRPRHNGAPRDVVDWTPELLARAKALWQAGQHTAAEIARTLGGNVTRDAVSAKAHRLGWGSHQPGPRPAGGDRRAFRGSALPRALRASKPVRPMPPAPPDVRNLTIFDLTESTCKWPVGEGTGADQRFCGVDRWRHDKAPYCEYHHRIAYQPVEARQSRRLVNLARAV